MRGRKPKAHRAYTWLYRKMFRAVLASISAPGAQGTREGHDGELSQGAAKTTLWPSPRTHGARLGARNPSRAAPLSRRERGARRPEKPQVARNTLRATQQAKCVLERGGGHRRSTTTRGACPPQKNDCGDKRAQPYERARPLC